VIPPVVTEANLILEHDLDRLKKDNSWYNDDIVNFIISIFCHYDTSSKNDKAYEQP